MRDGVAAIAESADGNTLIDPLAMRAAVDPRGTALKVKSFDRWIPVTWAQLFDEACTIAKGIAAAGVQPGDRIALQSGNRPEWIISEYAIWLVGAISVSISPAASPSQREWILSDSGAVGLFLGSARELDAFMSLRHRLPSIRQVWCYDDGALWSLAEAGEIVGDDDLDYRRATVTPGSPATICYPPGESDQPAGAVLTHGSVGHQSVTFAQGLPEVFHHEATLLVPLPLGDSFGQILRLACVGAGAATAVCDSQDAVAEFAPLQPTVTAATGDLLAEVIERARANARGSDLGRVFDRAAACAIRFGRAQQSGPGLRLRLEHAAFGPMVFRNLREDLGSRLDCVLLNEPALDPDLADFFTGLGIQVLRGYGPPEAGGAAHRNLPGATRSGSVGRSFPGATSRISSDGEVLVRGPGLFQGYWNNESATTDVLDSDGWLSTGDLGVLDGDGYLYLQDPTDRRASHPARRTGDDTSR